ncbi:MAG: hypothetical protein OXC26_14805 [Albidovulum sp.]|nr:hypothetical protein [Albidovulum sp.]
MAKRIDYFKGNRERVRYDSYRKRGVKIGSRESSKARAGKSHGRASSA